MAETKSAVEDEVILPRPFKLRLEANAAAGKKAKTLITREEHAPYISYGLHNMTKAQAADPAFDVVGYWQGIIIGIQGKNCGEVLYSWVAKMPPNYPTVPPIIRFVTKIGGLPFVNSRGFVDVNAIPNFKWKPSMNLADVLMAIRDCMGSKQCVDESYRLIGQEFFQMYEGDQIDRNFQ